MKLISFLLRTSRWTLMLAVVAGLLAGIANAGLLAAINERISNSPAGPSLVWRFIGLCLLMLLCRVASQILLLQISVDAVYNLRLHLSRRILSAELRHLEKLGNHRLLAAITDDVPVISNALVNIPLLCMHLAMVGAGLVYLAWLSWTVLLGVLAFMVVGVITYQLPITKAASLQRLTREEADSLFKHFRALTEGTKELKLHRQRREEFLKEGLQKTAHRLRRHAGVANSIYSAAASWGQILIFVLIGLVLFAVPAIRQLDVQTLAGYAIVILYMMAPLEVILNMFPTLTRANVSVQKIDELGLSLASFSNENDSTAELERDLSWSGLELRGVTHAYHEERREHAFTLGPLDLSFHPGELVFLIGGNGSGKTTFAKLLTGLYIPEAGEVRLDGQVVTAQNRDFYRQHFATVFSDFFLFESFLGIEAGKVDAQAKEYLVQLQLDHKVQIKDGVLSTTELSQGQRKRLALLTAYLEDRPFYVFDEWAADQDPLFKEVFYFQILPSLKAKGKTILVISHDDRYYQIADRIIKLDYGQVVYDKYTGPAETTAPAAAARM
jgi:putative ATP-binding cassette transporter